MSEPDRQKVELSRDIVQDAKKVLTHLAEKCCQTNGFGSFSISIYDTAWLAMIPAPGDPGHWLFPGSYAYLLLHQNDDGMWPEYASPIDGILNTLAGLLALVRHHESGTSNIDDPRGSPDRAFELPVRIEKARKALQSALSDWDVKETRHVGFEVLVPSLLSQLSDGGIAFEFEGRSTLMMLHQKKLSKFHPKVVTSNPPTTLLHS